MLTAIEVPGSRHMIKIHTCMFTNVPSDLASKPDDLQLCVIKLSTEDLQVCSVSDVAMPKPAADIWRINRAAVEQATKAKLGKA